MSLCFPVALWRVLAAVLLWRSLLFTSVAHARVVDARDATLTKQLAEGINKNRVMEKVGHLVPDTQPESTLNMFVGERIKYDALEKGPEPKPKDGSYHYLRWNPDFSEETDESFVMDATIRVLNTFNGIQNQLTPSKTTVNLQNGTKKFTYVEGEGAQVGKGKYSDCVVLGLGENGLQTGQYAVKREIFNLKKREEDRANLTDNTVEIKSDDATESSKLSSIEMPTVVLEFLFYTVLLQKLGEKYYRMFPAVPFCGLRDGPDGGGGKPYSDGTYELVMSLGGPNLNDTMHAFGFFGSLTTLGVFYQLLDVAIALEECKIFHRDFKPQNIIIDTADPKRVLVIDLGHAIGGGVINNVAKGGLGSAHFVSWRAQDGDYIYTGWDQLVTIVYLVLYAWFELPWSEIADDDLETLSRMKKEFEDVDRVVYDKTHQPPDEDKTFNSTLCGSDDIPGYDELPLENELKTLFMEILKEAGAAAPPVKGPNLASYKKRLEDLWEKHKPAEYKEQFSFYKWVAKSKPILTKEVTSVTVVSRDILKPKRHLWDVRMYFGIPPNTTPVSASGNGGE